ncbi:MAG: ferrochelatase [Planctomycetaceae bacterium]|jgi:ferrochelatase|nr:ferrochelatase [Planctomycetaceae bacterium]
MNEALLLISYGAPYCESDVIPFLDKLLDGKNVSEIYKKKAAAKYYDFAKRGGKYGLLNEQCDELLHGIKTEFNKIGLTARIYHGNLYWYPFLEDTISQMTNDGIRFAKCFITSAFDSTAGNRRYTNAITAICKKIGNSAPIIKRLPLPFNHPLFIEIQAERLCNAIKTQQTQNNNRDRTETIIFFTAHSIPKKDPFAVNYAEQLNFACRTIIEKCCSICPDFRFFKWKLLYQSQPISQNKNGDNSQWLLPSIKDEFITLVNQTEDNKINVTKNIIVSPIGFFCESMETVNDLDFELNDICKNSPIRFVRVLTVGTNSKTYQMITQLSLNSEMQ